MLTRERTKMIKGIAVVMMVALHTFMFCGDYFNSFTLFGRAISSFTNGSLKICVALYAFLTGYAYCKAKDKSYHYSVKKIFQLLKIYWFILLVIFLPLSILVGNYKLNWSFLYNLFALKNNLVTFAWYVYFYIFTMFCLPIYDKYLHFAKKKIKSGAGGVFLHLVPIAGFYLGFGLIQYLKIYKGIDNFLLNDLQDCLLYFQVIIIGYTFSEYALIDKISSKVRHKKLVGWGLTIVVPLMRNYCGSIAGFGFDIVYAPLMVIGILLILDGVNRPNIVCRGLSFLGSQSTEIWFIHSIFWSDCLTKKFAAIAYWPKLPILCVVWIIVLCIPVAIVAKRCLKLMEHTLKRVKED